MWFNNSPEAGNWLIDKCAEFGVVPVSFRAHAPNAIIPESYDYHMFVNVGDHQFDSKCGYFAATNVLYEDSQNAEKYEHPATYFFNTKAQELAEKGYPSGTLVVADKQESGKGRRGRSWVSPSGTGIFMTLMIKPDINPNNASMLTLVAALAVAKAITSVTGEEALIKWPNDIVINGKKVCGILTEMNAQFDYINHIVVGIGINVHNESFPEEISQMASSLMIEAGGKRFHRAQIIADTMSYFEQYYDTFLKTQDLSALVREYDELLVNRNKSVRVLDPKEPFDGKAMGITPKGELIVDTWESRKLVSSGEVSVRGIYGYV